MHNLLFKSFLLGSVMALTNGVWANDCFAQPLPTVSATLCEANPCTKEPYYVGFLKIFETMQKEMLAPKPTGNVTLDFLAEMIPHHEAAISMAKNILLYTKNPEIISIANTIIKEQTSGVEQMMALQASLKKNPPKPDSSENDYLKNFLAIYDTMVKKMGAAEPTCNVDVDFLAEMIPHHEGAIAMSENVLKYTQNKELQAIATNIVQTQSVQAKQLQALYDKLKK